MSKQIIQELTRTVSTDDIADLWETMDADGNMDGNSLAQLIRGIRVAYGDTYEIKVTVSEIEIE